MLFVGEPIPTPVEITFSQLTESTSPSAGPLLVAGLDVPSEPVQLAAAQALIRRGVNSGRLEIFRRLDVLPQSVLDTVERAAASLNSTFRQLLLQGSAENRSIGLRAVRLTHQYGQVGHIIELMNKPDLGDAELAVTTLRSLVNHLFDAWQSQRTTLGENTGLGAAARPQVIATLEQALMSRENPAYPEDLIESILVLSEPGHPVAKQILWHGTNLSREIAAQLLLTSRHPGILRFTAESLTEQYPHPKVFLAIRTRHDPEFLAALLRVISRKRSARQLEHLRQIQELEWLQPPFDVLAAIPANLQPMLIAFINATRIPRELKAQVQEWMLRFGSPDGKRAATDNLSLLEESVVQEVVRESLESEDADVQAWATSQVRQHAIPQAFSILIERLDSPLSSVQAAARGELAAFNVTRVLALADELSPEDAIRAGQLLIKVDIDAATNLRRALAHPARQKRLTAARNIARLGLQDRFTSAYVQMAHDNDTIARRTAAQVLATIPQIEAFRALTQLQDDAHPRVRETAAEALRNWPPASTRIAAFDQPAGDLQSGTAESDW